MGSNNKRKFFQGNEPKPYAAYFWIGVVIVAVLVALAAVAAITSRGREEIGIKAQALRGIRLPKIEVNLPVNSEATQVGFPRLRPRLSGRAIRAVGCDAWRVKIERLRLVSMPRSPGQGRLKVKARAYLPYRFAKVYIRESTDANGAESGSLTLNPAIPPEKRERLLAQLEKYRDEISSWRMRVAVKDSSNQIIRATARASCDEISCVFNAEPLTLDITQPFRFTINFLAPRGEYSSRLVSVIKSGKIHITPQTERKRRGSFKISGNVQQIEVTGSKGSREGTIILQDAAIRQHVAPFSFLRLLPEPRRQQVIVKISEQTSQQQDNGVAWRKFMRAKRWFEAYERVRNPSNISAGGAGVLAPPRAEVTARRMLGKNTYSVIKNITVTAVAAQSQAEESQE